MKYPEGTCACGHVGHQKRPDICGPCFRDANRVRICDNAEKNRLARMETVRRKFYGLEPIDQAKLVNEFLNHIS